MKTKDPRLHYKTVSREMVKCCVWDTGQAAIDFRGKTGTQSSITPVLVELRIVHYSGELE